MSTETLEKIELEKVFIELLEPDIILFSCKDASMIEAEDVQLIKTMSLKLTGGREYGVILDSRNYNSISPEARELMASKSIEKKKVATGIVINNLPQRILGNFYIQFNKPNIPTKLFEDRDSALSWVKEHLNN